MLANSKKGLVSEINVTPFVDVMLVLLIIFMVSAPMLSEGVDVNLPETQEVKSLSTTEDKNLVLSITKEGKLFLGRQEVTIKNLDKVLAATVTDQNKQLFLQADRDVPYGRVVEVMGIAKSAGIQNVGLVAERPGKEK